MGLLSGVAWFGDASLAATSLKLWWRGAAAGESRSRSVSTIRTHRRTNGLLAV